MIIMQIYIGMSFKILTTNVLLLTSYSYVYVT